MGRKRTGQIIELAPNKFQIRFESKIGGRRKNTSKVLICTRAEAEIFRLESLEKLNQYFPPTRGLHRNELDLLKKDDLLWDVPKKYWNKLYSAAKKRTRINGKEFSLTRQEYFDLVHETKGVCQVTGITFSMQNENGWRCKPFAPSLDRVDCSLGYSAKNCRIICVAVNTALNEWGDKVFSQVATGYLDFLQTRLVSRLTADSDTELTHKN